MLAALVANRLDCVNILAAVRAEQGEEGVRDLAEGLALLRQQGGRYAAYWRCPCCDTRLLSAEAFVQHLQVRLNVVGLGRVAGLLLGQKTIGAWFAGGASYLLCELSAVVCTHMPCHAMHQLPTVLS